MLSTSWCVTLRQIGDARRRESRGHSERRAQPHSRAPAAFQSVRALRWRTSRSVSVAACRALTLRTSRSAAPDSWRPGHEAAYRSELQRRRRRGRALTDEGLPRGTRASRSLPRNRSGSRAKAACHASRSSCAVIKGTKSATGVAGTALSHSIGGRPGSVKTVWKYDVIMSVSQLRGKPQRAHSR